MKQKLFYLFLPFLLGGIVGLIIDPYMDYDVLAKPPLSPPGIVFPIAWTILYLLMGISSILILQKEKMPIVYYIQLLVNLLWPIFYFIFKIRTFSLIWIIFLIILVIKMIYQFYKINKTAAYLQIPYLLWLLFASYLNLGTILLN